MKQNTAEASEEHGTVKDTMNANISHFHQNTKDIDTLWTVHLEGDLPERVSESLVSRLEQDNTVIFHDTVTTTC